MRSGLHIHTLGGLAIWLDDAALPKQASRKAEALLVYLAETARSHSREELGDFLWNDLPSSRSLSNLSVLLTSLRKDLSDYIWADRYEIGLRADAPVWVDALHFEQQINAVLTDNKIATGLNPEQAEYLKHALDAYRGDFLSGFHIREARGFEEWAILERERLQHLAGNALAALVKFALHNREFQRGIKHANRLLSFDPYQEGTHRQLMLLWARLGQRSKALEQYERCKRLLADELGVAPSLKTNRLYQHICTADSSARQKLPQQTTPFVGRAAELMVISERLSHPECRLLTLLGPGGIGKTRLALQAAETNKHRFLNGVAFVPLESLTRPEAVAPAIMEALEFPFLGHESYPDQLIRHLSSREVLLVLDNFEHLLPATNLLDQILRRTPDVKIMVTSRERLNLLAEWLVEVPGLQHSQPDDRGGNISDAVVLFMKSAQRVKTDFDLNPERLPLVNRICQILDGSPLGIELTAFWLQKLTLAQIVAETQQGLDILQAPLCDLPARHRSLRVVFDQSWKMLSAEEKRVLRQLSIFPGTFSRKAAQEITAASRHTLSTLVKKAILQNHTGRYRIHGLLRQYAAEQLALVPQEEAQLEEAFMRFYTNFLHQEAQNFEGAKRNKTLQRIHQEFENIRLAWQFAVAKQDYRLLAHGLEALYQFLRIKSRFQEGVDILAKTLEMWAEDHKHDLLFGKVLARQGAFLQFLGKPEATDLLQQGLEYARRYDEPHEQVFCLVLLANALRHQGDFKQLEIRANQALEIAEQSEYIWGMVQAYFLLGRFYLSCGQIDAAAKIYEKGLEVSRQSPNARLSSIMLRSLGDVALYQGDYARAQALMEESLALSRQFGDRYREALQLNNLGEVFRLSGNYQQAERCYQKSLTICEEIGDVTGKIYALSNLGDNALRQKDIIAARVYCERSLNLAQQHKNQIMVAANLNNLGEIDIAAGDLAQAETRLRNALQITAEIEEIPFSLNILFHIAEIQLQRDEREKAEELLTIVANHPATERHNREQAAQYLKEFNSDSSSTPTRDLEEIIKGLLK